MTDADADDAAGVGEADFVDDGGIDDAGGVGDAGVYEGDPAFTQSLEPQQLPQLQPPGSAQLRPLPGVAPLLDPADPLLDEFAATPVRVPGRPSAMAMSSARVAPAPLFVAAPPPPPPQPLPLTLVIPSAQPGASELFPMRIAVSPRGSGLAPPPLQLPATPGTPGTPATPGVPGSAGAGAGPTAPRVRVARAKFFELCGFRFNKFNVGVAVCILSGCAASLLNVGFVFGDSIADLAVARGCPRHLSGNVVWALCLTVAFLVTAVYSAVLLTKHGTWHLFKEWYIHPLGVLHVDHGDDAEEALAKATTAAEAGGAAGAAGPAGGGVTGGGGGGGTIGAAPSLLRRWLGNGISMTIFMGVMQYAAIAW